MALRLVWEYSLKDRGRALFQGCKSKSNASRVLYPRPRRRKVLQVSCTVPSFLLTTILLLPGRALPRRCTMYIYLIFLFGFRSVFAKYICQVCALAVLWFASQTCLEACETGFPLDETQPGGHTPGPYLKLPTGKFLHRTTIEVIQNNFPRTHIPWFHGFNTSCFAVHICSDSDAVLADVGRAGKCCQEAHL